MNIHSTSEASEAYIALGANLGNREATLKEALHRLDQHEAIKVLRCSRIYETEPVGYLDQPQFLNMAAALRTTLAPEELLREMLEIENQLGRVRDIRYGPRTVDLDLLWVEGRSLDTPDLTLPHPRMMERAFVLVPLSDIVPQDDSQGLLYGRLAAALKDLDGKEGMRLWTSNEWEDGSEHSGS
ncbi:2-amino-4-hydroxy-6-hydroxymethyldihydropteridine pyrophosphokinase [Paenibacillus sp. FSL R7-0273]|uniref:2-amino-4-hydroxy-6- hydroxymethyldihydropteridine diphosphokinase n=1 Tax=Paenibacillus sp. FSL R7-0273 TaxID=1536772 RepID=UPI0004F7CBF3|nr:2-amino-4-hydroxy-6-hydroxymethyldihydropteridine diphosphokinase [Paenibacillus sp. FSL R7-0273]AIQ44543.1 2-amino-4-hydroxy-6-hydroxymethyldihydropteridine pyrophosphokinase [Paenibacillus sp. FSL R7-0273]OMF85425.1 2-amino-4-hydroxy-6-hydroxymethyldihydropteridine diphosphokinase [Paenibacillus sp. FSL R7-0273]